MSDSVEKLRAIVEASQNLTATLDLEQVLQIVLDTALKELDSEHGTIYLVDLEKMQIYSRIVRSNESQEIRLPIGSGLAGTAAKTGRPIIVDDAYADPRFDKSHDQESGFHTGSVLCLPLMRGRSMQGVLQVMDKAKNKYRDVDMSFLKALAAHMAIAVENARLMHHQKQLLSQQTNLVNKLNLSYHEMITRLSLAAERKDTDTGKHIERMARFCTILGRKSGMNEKECETFYYAAKMHDIGKIGIPDNILKKSGPLDDDEYTVMKTHTTIGASILSHSESEILRMAFEVCLSHHEKWDGSGYPSHLKGHQISLVGRIAALADVFDAILSKRVYKEAYSLEKTLEIIKDGSGKHFDPFLVNILLENTDEFLAAREEVDES
jgi:response regulator RpfG family c-di-GMP phosphodiesterase